MKTVGRLTIILFSLFSLQKPASLAMSLLLDGTNQVKQLIKHKTI